MNGTGRTVLVAALITVLVVVGGAAYFLTTGTRLPWSPAETPTRFLLVAGSADDAGAVVAQVIALVDTGQQTVTAVAPDLAVTIPGTTYSELKDAYPFGGGAAVAEAYAKATGTTQLPYIAISPGQLLQAIDGLATVSVTLPADMDVFDGDTLYSFEAGTCSLSGAEFAAVAKGRPYLTRAQRTQLDDSLAAALVNAAAVWPGGLEAALKDGELKTDIPPKVFSDLVVRLSAFAQ
jgi:hypothetical protein